MAQDKQDEETAARLRVAVLRLARTLRHLTNGEGLSPAESASLGTIVRQGRIGIGELANAERLNPTMVSRIIARLEALDYVERVTDEVDRRAGLVEPTPGGRRFIKQVQKQRTALLLGSLEHLTEDQYDDLVRALPALEALADAHWDET